MIATVRIAPVERWCEYEQKRMNATRKKSVGMPVKIITDSCAKSFWCDGKTWQQEDVDEFRIALGIGPRVWNLSPRFLCEHMLEMD